MINLLECSITSLSGSQAERVKLCRKVSKRGTGRTLYLLDEPTTGLHFHDIRQLLHVLHRLTDAGNTVIVIEHNLEVIKTADWIIDLGPSHLLHRPLPQASFEGLILGLAHGHESPLPLPVILALRP
jgi:ABC-type Mn2+/Zn2+ transport system ATPase subunit